MIVVADQLVKHWIVGSFERDTIHSVVGDWLRIDFIHNGGGLFGYFQGSALAFALVTVVVAILIAAMEISWGWRSWFVTLALGLLMGGAIGNLIDRVRLGYVVDFVDIGIGRWRFYTFNVADMAVTSFFLLMMGMWILAPRLLSGGSGEAGAGADGEGPAAE